MTLLMSMQMSMRIGPQLIWGFLNMQIRIFRQILNMQMTLSLV